MINKELLEDCINNTPLALLSLTDKEYIDAANSYLPYSIGFEIECNRNDDFNEDIYKKIPNILNVDCAGEHRFRIPHGINGFICLWNICQQLPIDSTLNDDSGIHYHTDLTDCWKDINNTVIEKNNDWIIQSLINWNTAKEVNSDAKCRINSGGWVNFQSGFKTCEIRIGEMTFDYKIIIRRMLQATNIVKQLKTSLSYNVEDIVYPDFNPDKQIEYVTYIDKQLIISKEKELKLKLEEIKKIKIKTSEKEKVFNINKRIIKI